MCNDLGRFGVFSTAENKSVDLQNPSRTSVDKIETLEGFVPGHHWRELILIPRRNLRVAAPLRAGNLS